MENAAADIARYFEEMRVRIGVADETQKELDRLVAPDFNLFSILWPDEVRLSNMIAQLLNPSESHGQGSIFLYAFLDTLENNNPFILAAHKIRDFKHAWIDSKNIQVEIEQSTGMIEATQRRMDILVRGSNYGLMIENKPWAADQKDQMKDYRGELSKRFRHGQHAMIYLSGDGTPPTEYSLSAMDRNTFEQNGELLVIAYRPHLTDWLQRCLALAEADRVRWVIKDFIAYIETSFPNSRSSQVEAR